jgi:hypothetical protein
VSYIRKVRTTSGATAIQIAHKEHGQVVGIEHLGSTHNDEELRLLLELARTKLVADGQQSLFGGPGALTSSGLDPNLDLHLSPLTITLLRSYSDLLYYTLARQYTSLGFDDLGDKMFKNICIARIVEPVSKLDSVRVLSELGVDGISSKMIYRCLKRVIKDDYRKTISELCYNYASVKGISLLLYDVTIPKVK